MAGQPRLSLRAGHPASPDRRVGESNVTRPVADLDIIADGGPAWRIAHGDGASRHGTLRSFRRYRDLGINIGMGTDTHPPGMLLNMQLGVILARVVEGDAQAVRSQDLYNAATLGGARALGRNDLGRLEPGAQADLIVIDLDHPSMCQVIDPI